MADRFLGRWELIPELSIFQTGTPAVSGLCTIELHGRMCHVAIAWRELGAEGDQTVGFASPIDGEIQRTPAYRPGFPDGFSLIRVDEGTLDSHAYIGDEVVMYSRRAASADGQLLSTVHEQNLPGQPHSRNFQVYRRL